MLMRFCNHTLFVMPFFVVMVSFLFCLSSIYHHLLRLLVSLFPVWIGTPINCQHHQIRCSLISSRLYSPQSSVNDRHVPMSLTNTLMRWELPTRSCFANVESSPPNVCVARLQKFWHSQLNERCPRQFGPKDGHLFSELVTALHKHKCSSSYQYECKVKNQISCFTWSLLFDVVDTAWNED